MNMKIKMLSSERGSEDGVNNKLYEEGKTYDVSEGLGIAFVEHAKCAEVISRDTVDEDNDLDEDDGLGEVETPEKPASSRRGRGNK